jgi:hypothetical protein
MISLRKIFKYHRVLFAQLDRFVKMAAVCVNFCTNVDLKEVDSFLPDVVQIRYSVNLKIDFLVSV